MSTTYQQETWARLVFDLSVVAIVVGELFQAVKWRRGAPRADLGAEVAFRVLFLAGILMLTLANGHAPEAQLEAAAWFVVGALIGWWACCCGGGAWLLWAGTSRLW